MPVAGLASLLRIVEIRGLEGSPDIGHSGLRVYEVVRQLFTVEKVGDVLDRDGRIAWRIRRGRRHEVAEKLDQLASVLIDPIEKLLFLDAHLRHRPFLFCCSEWLEYRTNKWGDGKACLYPAG